MDPIELVELLKNANLASRRGFSDQEIDAYLIQRVGLTKKALAAAVRELPKEEVRIPTLRTRDILRAEAYGATLGVAPHIEALLRAYRPQQTGTWKRYREAYQKIQEEQRAFEKDFPQLARAAKTFGAVIPGAAAGYGVARGLGALGVSSKVVRGTLAGAASGVPTGKAAMDNPAAGALAGAIVGTAVPPLAAAAGSMSGAAGQHWLRRLIPWLGGGIAGAGGTKLLDYLTGGR